MQVLPGASTCACVSARAEAGLTGLREVAVVDDAVAVVVDAVAGLGLRHAGRVARRAAPFVQTNVPDWQVPRPLPHVSPTPGSVPSSICRCSCRRCRCRPRAAASPRARRRTVPVLSALQARMPPRRQAPTPLLSRTRRHEAFVDVAVAVVVETVAELGRDGAAAGLAAGVRAESLRRLTVAVVVLAVAGLDRAVPGGAAVLGHHVVRVGLAVGGIVEAAAGGDRVADRARPACSTRPRRSGRCSCRRRRCRSRRAGQSWR